MGIYLQVLRPTDKSGRHLPRLYRLLPEFLLRHLRGVLLQLRLRPAARLHFPPVVRVTPGGPGVREGEL